MSMGNDQNAAPEKTAGRADPQDDPHGDHNRPGSDRGGGRRRHHPYKGFQRGMRRRPWRQKNRLSPAFRLYSEPRKRGGWLRPGRGSPPHRAQDHPSDGVRMAREDSQGWWYACDETTNYINGWASIDGKSYHFDEEGYRDTGWTAIGGLGILFR